jgi:DNA-binding NarL/FixJ family response regulator
MKRLLIIDDHAVVREGLKRLFESEAGAAFGEAGDAAEAMRLAEEQKWDIAILDLSLGSQHGLSLLKELKQRWPKLPVLVLSISGGEQYARRAFQLGAGGYATKDLSGADLRQAIYKVMEGGRYVSSAVAEEIAAGLAGNPEGPRHDALSDREFEVMRLIASGRGVGEIAGLLHLSDKTISTYRARILEKMGMKTNSDITRYAIRNRLVD